MSSISNSISSHSLVSPVSFDQTCCGVSSNLLECPVSHSIMNRPMINNAGQTYEENFARSGLGKNDYKTRKAVTAVVENFALRNVIIEWKLRCGQNIKLSLPFQGFMSENSPTELLTDPMIDSHGHSFNRSFIEGYLRDHNNFCPLDDQEPVTFVVKNYALNHCVEVWSTWKSKQTEQIETQASTDKGKEPDEEGEETENTLDFVNSSLYNQSTAVNAFMSNDPSSALTENEREKLALWIKNTKQSELVALIKQVALKKSLTYRSVLSLIASMNIKPKAMIRLEDTLGIIIRDERQLELKQKLSKAEKSSQQLSVNNGQMQKALNTLQDDYANLENQFNQTNALIDAAARQAERQIAMIKITGIALASIGGAGAIAAGLALPGAVPLGMAAIIGVGGGIGTTTTSLYGDYLLNDKNSLVSTSFGSRTQPQAVNLIRA